MKAAPSALPAIVPTDQDLLSYLKRASSEDAPLWEDQKEPRIRRSPSGLKPIQYLSLFPALKVHRKERHIRNWSLSRGSPDNRPATLG